MFVLGCHCWQSTLGGGCLAAACSKSAGCRQVRELIGGEVAPDEPLAAQGLDSLAGMELRQKLQVLDAVLLPPLPQLLLLSLPPLLLLLMLSAYPDVSSATHVHAR